MHQKAEKLCTYLSAAIVNLSEAFALAVPGSEEEGELCRLVDCIEVLKANVDPHKKGKHD